MDWLPRRLVSGEWRRGRGQRRELLGRLQRMESCGGTHRLRRDVCSCRLWFLGLVWTVGIPDHPPRNPDCPGQSRELHLAALRQGDVPHLWRRLACHPCHYGRGQTHGSQPVRVPADEHRDAPNDGLHPASADSEPVSTTAGARVPSVDWTARDRRTIQRVLTWFIASVFSLLNGRPPRFLLLYALCCISAVLIISVFSLISTITSGKFGPGNPGRQTPKNVHDTEQEQYQSPATAILTGCYVAQPDITLCMQYYIDHSLVCSMFATAGLWPRGCARHRDLGLLCGTAEDAALRQQPTVNLGRLTFPGSRPPGRLIQ